MTRAIASGDPALIEKSLHLEEVQRNRRRSAKEARAAGYLKRGEKATNGRNGKCGGKGKARPQNTTQGNGRNGKTSLTRTLSAPAKTIQDLFRRHLEEQEVDPDSITEISGWSGVALPDPVLSLLESVVGLIRDGENVDKYRERLVTLLSGEKQMAELNEVPLRIHDRHRLVRLIQAQDYLEGFILKCVYRHDLKPGEGLAAAQMLGKEADAIRARLKDPVNLTATEVEKLIVQINPSDILNEKELAERWAGTSPQGREIMRRVAHAIMKAQKKKQSAGTESADLMAPGDEPGPAPSIQALVDDIAQKNGTTAPVDEESDLNPPAVERTPAMEAFIAKWRGRLPEGDQRDMETPSPPVVARAPGTSAERNGRPARVFVA